MKRFYTILYCLLFVACFNQVSAQISYSFTATSGAYSANGGTTLTGLGASIDDATSSSTSIGFTFTYGCVNYTTFQASTNGVMFLGTSAAGTNVTNNLNSSTDRPAIAPLWDDLKTSASGSVNYSLTGSAPNRVLTVEWLNMLWQYSAASASISFQVKLYETSNRVEFIYSQLGGTVSSGSASIGLSGPTSGDFYSLSSSGASPTANYGSETTTISTRPATNQIYRWDPNCATITTGVVSPTSISLGSCTATATASVSFTSTGTFYTGNTYYVYLSDGSGSFATATQVGSLSSTANSGSITITIPAGTLAGTNYMVQISSYTPSVVGTTSGPFTITTTCNPGTPISGMMSNCAALQVNNSSGYGCDVNCNETGYTIGPFAGNSASSVLCAGGANVTCSGSPACKSFTQSVTFTLTAGCTYTAEAAYGARGVNCPDGAMDGGDQIHITGTGGTIVSQIAQIVTTSFCAAIGSAGTYTYSTADLNTGCSNAEGYAKFVYTAPVAATAQITISYTSDRCDEILTYTFTANDATCGIIVLPVELLALTANRINNNVILVKWATSSEVNNDYFMLQYSLDGKNFINYKEVKGEGNSSTRKEYECPFNENIGNNTPYFRLKQVDFNGKYKYSTIITLGNYIGSLYQDASKTAIFYNNQNDKVVTRFHLDYPQNVIIDLYDITGNIIQEINQVNLNEGDNEILIDAPDKAGVYFLVYQAGDNAPIHKKIVVSK